MQRPRTLRHLFASAALGLGLAAPSVAFDRIYLADGTIIEDVKIVSETIQKVLYKPEKGRSEKEVTSDQILSVEFTNRPQEISEAEIDAVSGALLGAVSGFSNYLGGLGEKGDRKFPWAAAYSRFRLVEVHEQLGAIDDMVAAVDELVALHTDSRYVPIAMIKKIEAQLLMGDKAGAKATTETFDGYVQSNGLPLRWQFEATVRRVLTDSSLEGTKLESSLEKVSRDAAAFPTVANRADVAIGESLLQRGEFSGAEDMFQGVVEAPNADDRTLAAAWTGLGDCLYRRAEAASTAGNSEDAKELFERARISFMRVVVLYKTELSYVPKAAFYAGRCFQEIGGEGSAANSRRLLRYVVLNFRGSRWYDSAKEFDRRN